jgi:putative transposase
MCDSVYDNPHAERINGTIKNDYLSAYGPETYIQLSTMTAKAVLKYNKERPHQSIGNISPCDYEKELKRKSVEVWITRNEYTHTSTLTAITKNELN